MLGFQIGSDIFDVYAKPHTVSAMHVLFLQARLRNHGSGGSELAIVGSESEHVHDFFFAKWRSIRIAGDQLLACVI